MAMPEATIPTATGMGSVASILTPSFGADVVDAGTLAQWVFKVLTTIAVGNYPVNIYVTRDISQRIASILVSMNIKFRTVEVSRMEGPYIFISSSGHYVVVETADENGNILARHQAPLEKFIESFRELYARLVENKKRAEERAQSGEGSAEAEGIEVVDQIILSPQDAEKLIEMIKRSIGEIDLGGDEY